MKKEKQSQDQIWLKLDGRPPGDAQIEKLKNIPKGVVKNSVFVDDNYATYELPLLAYRSSINYYKAIRSLMCCIKLYTYENPSYVYWFPFLVSLSNFLLLKKL